MFISDWANLTWCSDFSSITDKTKNRGFAFVEYVNHRAASKARRKLIPERVQLWGKDIAVDWAEPENEIEEDIMSKVKHFYFLLALSCL